MANTKEKKLTKYEQNAARRNARSIGDSGASQTAQSSVHKSDKQRQLEQFAQNFEQKYGKPIQTANQANTANQTGTASKSAVQSQKSYNQPSVIPGMDLGKEDNDTVYDTAVRRLKTLYQHQNDLASRSATMDPAEYSRQWNETQKQVKQLEALQSTAAASRYHERNQEQIAKAMESNAGAIYQRGQSAKSDQQTILQLVAPNAENQPGYQEAVQKISTEYGISPEKSGTQYQQDLYKLYENLGKTRERSRQSVNSYGYDYDEMEQYQQRQREEAENIQARQNVISFAKEHPVAASALSVAVQPAAGLDYLQQLISNIGHNDMDNAETYRPLSANNMTISNFVNDVRGSVSEEIEKNTDWEIFGQNVASFAYQTGMSIADSALLVGTMGSGASLFMGLSSAAQGASDALSRGANNSQAILAGLASGAAEMLFEKFSIDQLLKPKSVTSVKRLLQETLKQAGVEASEEGLTEISNILTDAAIMGESSNFSSSVEQYKAQGMSESAAQKQAYLDMIGQVGWAAAGGALSGGVMGGPVNAMRYVSERSDAGDAQMNAAETNPSPVQAQAMRQEARRAGAADTSRPASPAAPLKGSLGASQDAVADSSPQGEPSMRQVDKMAATFGKSGEAAFRAAAKNTPAEALPDLYDSFVASYNSASRKITPEQADRINHMPADLRTAAYQAGIADYSASAKQAAKPGLVKDQTYRKARYTAKTERTLDTIAKAAGVQVKIVDKIPAYDANGNPLGMANARYHNGTIEIARNAKDPAGVAFTHEIVHRVRQADPEAYRAMARLVIDSLSDERYSSALASRSKEYRDLDESNMQEELVADAFGRVLGDSEYLDRIVRQNRTVWQRILDTIQDFISRIRHASSIGLNESERQEFSELAGRAEQMASLLENALDRAQTAQNIQTENAAQKDGAERYSINQLFNSEVQEWYDEGRPEGERFTLGSTGPVLQGLGAIESDIYMNSDKINTILETHPEMTIREIQRIPEILEDPILVLKSRNVHGARSQYGNSRLTLFGSVKALDGRPVMCVMDLRPTENGFLLDDMQKVNSAYTKDTNPIKFVQASDVLYADKNRTIPLLRGMGFQMPMSLLQNGSVGSISYGGKNVNISGVPFSSVVEIDRDNPNQTASPDTRYSLMSSEISDMSNRLTEQMQAVNARVDTGEITQEEATAQKMAILQAPIRDLIAQYGQMEPGERPFRDITIPRKTGENMRVSRTARTALEAEATPDELVPDIEQMVAEGAFSYEAYGDEQAIQDAENKILEAGYETALTDWTRDVRSGNVSKLNTALGWRLYDEAANRQDMKTAMTVLTNLIEHQRNAAQAVQATRILKQMPPSAQLYGVQRSIQNLQEEINRRYGAKKGPELKIDEDLAQQFMEAQSQQERDAVLKEIYRDIGRQMPSTFLDKWNAWRYFAMLGNPRTHIRNIVGNLGFAPVVAAKNLTATAIESAVYRVTGGRTQRTKGAIGAGKADRALLKACWGDYSNVQDVAMGSAKYNDSVNANQYIQEGRRIFKSENRTLNKLFSPIEKASRGNSRLLEAEDLVFFKPHYAYALAQYCKANHISAEAVQSGKIPDAARAYAIREAQKATYRDTNQFSQIISNLGRTDRETALGKGLGMVAEGILPFRKTPANILVRGLEYSPLGLLNALKIGVKDVKTGKATAADVIDALSSGLTGTGLLALGFFLAAEGIILGGGEDEDESKFLELQGHQQYSLEVGGQSFTLDWLAPEALPFFVGVNLYEQSGKEGGATAADWLTAIQNISEPLLEMSCLQSLNDMFDNIGYVQSEGLSGLTAALVGAATSYLTQAIPTVFGQLERISQQDRMTTFTNQDDILTTNMQYTLGKASARIPGWDYQQIPYIDAWGRTESEDSTTARAVDNFFNPAYRSEPTESSMENELLRLYEQTGNAAVFPSRAGKTVTVSGEKKYLNANEYVQYATEKGQMSYEIMTDLVKNSAYKNLSDEDKVEVISDVYSYANAVAKTSVSDYTPESWIQKASAAEAEGIPVELYIVAKHATGSVTEGIPSKSDPSKSIENSTSLLKMQQLYHVKGLTDEQRQTLYESFNISESVRNYNKAAVDEKIQRMRQRGR